MNSLRRITLWHVVIMAVALAVLSACENPVARATKYAVSLAYTGPISFGEPVVSRRQVVIPVIIDYSRGRWAMDSARGPYRTLSRIKGNTIEFSVLTVLSGGNLVPELELPGLIAGKYAMIYVDPDGATHPLGSITVHE